MRAEHWAYRLLLAYSFGLCCCVPVPACAQAPPPPSAPEELYLEVSVNGEDSGLILRFRQGPSGLRSSVQNLRELGLDPALFGVAGQDEFELARVPGLRYDYDTVRQRLNLQLADALRPPFALDARGGRPSAPASVTPGLLLNYDAYAQLGRERRLAIFNEWRYFSAAGAFSSSGLWNASGIERNYIRLDSYWLREDETTMRSVQIGDFVSGSLSWSRALRMGGVQWRRNFDLRPDLLTYPVASLGGSAVVPGVLQLYVNGVQQYSAEVPSGPFVVRQIAGLNGAGQATVVTRDAAGRAISATLPLYVDTRMLSEGLSDYALELGALRHGYGSRSFGYALPAVSASWRHGLTPSLTLEAHGEAGGHLVNGGGGLLWRLGQVGVLSAALAGSYHSRALPPVAAGGLGGAQDGGDSGTANGAAQGGAAASGAARRGGGQLALGYQYLGRRFSFDLLSVRASSGYADLGCAQGAPVLRGSDRMALNLALSSRQSLSLAYTGARPPAQPAARIAALSYSLSMGNGLYLGVSAFRDLKDRAVRGLFFNLSYSFDNRVNAAASSGRQNGVRSKLFSLTRAPDFGGGLGWALQKGSIDQTAVDQAQVQYLGDAGQLSLLTQGRAGQRGTSLSASGALVAMDGTVVAARQVGSGFALVSTGVAGVPVVHENREIGHTGRSGYLLVPNLLPYALNRLAIDTGGLAADARVRRARAEVAPRRLAGVLAAFPVERYRAATIVVQQADGTPMPVGTPVRHVQSGAEAVIGYDGMTFVDELGEENELVVGKPGAQCYVRFRYQPAANSALPVLGPFPCQPAAGGR
ncbi:fimbria/pilus outer membrane usher protein [Massilia sp. BJB1822]|uniref:fimbria/pilus outer membrane usher protein n=1 Tax=Massilia sp. BJB1822 TaxID=2744470 RepID=UPI0015949ED7|nr:fimbria/pilus outer membrane usher protein [Massilia sp. BJB1822]NVD99553.1 fimbrial biogenesis outer membrane usher protein [Massilia sp. BJB1822]